MTSTRHDPWPEQYVQGVADVLGHTQTGLSGAEIGRLLAQVRVPDLQPGLTKRLQLHEALSRRQARDGAANCVIAFVRAAMAPVHYRNDPQLFTLRQDGLNEVLVYLGPRVDDTGAVARGAQVTNLSGAARHANTVHAELRRRGTHQAVLDYCTQELLAKDAFHAALEANKGVAQRLRDFSGHPGDGAELVDAVLARGRAARPVLARGRAARPVLAVNPGRTDTDRGEQTGFATLVKGVFGLYRNPVAHDPRVRRTVTDDELLELLTTLSMIHRRLDEARRRPPPPPN